MKNLKSRIFSAFRPKAPTILDPTPKPWSAEKLKKAKVSSGTLERDILEQREIRSLERPNGRRAFFRGVAGAVGLKVLAEKVPQAYFEDNALAFMPPEFVRFVNEAEGHNFRIGGCLNSATSLKCPSGHTKRIWSTNCCPDGVAVYCNH